MGSQDNNIINELKLFIGDTGMKLDITVINFACVNMYFV